MHALDAAVLFSAAGEDEVIEYDGDEGDEWDVDGWDSRGAHQLMREIRTYQW